MNIKEMLKQYGGAPHLNVPTIAFLDRIVTKHSNILEFGSGSSTLWFAKRCKHIVSYESEKGWWDAIVEQAKTLARANIDIRLEPKYWELFETQLAESLTFDIILIDGVEHAGAREACVRKAWHYLTEGGYLILDDTHRPQYKKSVEFIDSFNWKRWHITGPDYWNDEGNNKRATIWQYKGKDTL